MLRRALLALSLATLLCPIAGVAQTTSRYSTVELDGVFAKWDEITKTYTPGMSVMQPQKVRFTAKYVGAPRPCNTEALQTIFNALGQPGLFKQAAITHCIEIGSDKGRTVIAWIQDVLIPGFKADAKPDDTIEIYADLLAYGVGSDRARNMPLMLVNAFKAP